MEKAADRLGASNDGNTTLKLTSKQLVLHARVASEEKKGVDPLILDLRKLTDIADFFLIVHGTSDRHVRTIADAVEEHLARKKAKPIHVEGRNNASWVLLDYGDVIVHVFHHQMRKFYNLERLWGDARVVTVKSKHERQVKRNR